MATYDGNPNSSFDATKRESGFGALGMGLMNGDMSDDDDEDDPFDDSHKKVSLESQNQPPKPQQPQMPQAHIPLAAPKPGYAAPVAALNLRPATSPSPQMAQLQAPRPLMLVNSKNIPPPAPISVPSTPHPLQPPMTPILPVFARPTASRDVQFSAPAQPILRSDKEETMLPKRGEKGDDFWRRFSMVVREESSKKGVEKTSPWLRETQSGASRLSRWVWIIGLALLICIAGGIGLGWYIAHNDTSHNAPTVIGGGENEKAAPVASSTPVKPGVSSSPHVSPTNTVARRDIFSDVVPTSLPNLSVGRRHRRRALNRTSH